MKIIKEILFAIKNMFKERNGALYIDGNALIPAFRKKNVRRN